MNGIPILDAVTWMPSDFPHSAPSSSKSNEAPIEKTYQDSNSEEEGGEGRGGDSKGGGGNRGGEGAIGMAVVVTNATAGSSGGDSLDTFSSNDSQNENELLGLTRKLIQVRNILKTIKHEELALQLPSIVVIGSQSSGKSSVLEAIVGQEFLPK